METSKRWVKLFSLIFILKCLSKFSLIRTLTKSNLLNKHSDRDITKENPVLGFFSVLTNRIHLMVIPPLLEMYTTAKKKNKKKKTKQKRRICFTCGELLYFDHMIHDKKNRLFCFKETNQSNTFVLMSETNNCSSLTKESHC